MSYFMDKMLRRRSGTEWCDLDARRRLVEHRLVHEFDLNAGKSDEQKIQRVYRPCSTTDNRRTCLRKQCETLRILLGKMNAADWHERGRQTKQEMAREMLDETQGPICLIFH